MLIPPTLRWELTMNCNLACRHCQVGASLTHAGTHPPWEIVRTVAEKLTRKTCTHVNLLGGEPLSFPRIHDLLRVLIANGVSFNITTNGLLVDESLPAAIRNSNNGSVTVSVDGPDASSHERIRGGGTFERTLANVRLLVRSLNSCGTQVILCCTLYADTVARVSEVIALAQDLGVDKLELMVVKPVGNAALRFGEIGVDRSVLTASVIEHFRHNPLPMPGQKPQVAYYFLDNGLRLHLGKELGMGLPVQFVGCRAGYSLATIDWHGRLWPCDRLRPPVADSLRDYFDFGDNSLLTNTIDNIWHSPGCRRLRELNSRQLHIAHGYPCRVCAYGLRCAPCPLPYVLGQSMDQPHCLEEMPASAFNAEERSVGGGTAFDGSANAS